MTPFVPPFPWWENNCIQGGVRNEKSISWWQLWSVDCENDLEQQKLKLKISSKCSLFKFPSKLHSFISFDAVYLLAASFDLLLCTFLSWYDKWIKKFWSRSKFYVSWISKEEQPREEFFPFLLSRVFDFKKKVYPTQKADLIFR